MGLFFYTKKGSIISTVDLPTTEIIEPLFIYPFLTLILGEAGILWSKWHRKKTNLRSYPILLASEIKFIQILSLIVLIFILVILHQVF